MKTILVPTDFSKNAYGALFYATQLFKTVDVKFILLHSIENQVSKLTSRVDIGKTEKLAEELYTTSEAKCDETRHKIILDSQNKKHTFESIVTSLTLFRAVNKLIAKENIDYVIMGNKGVTASIDIFTGSNTLAVIRKIKNAPLLIVPQELNYTPIKKIAFASGFKRQYSNLETQPLLFLSLLTKASIKVLHIHENKKMSDTQRKHFHQLYQLLKMGQPETIWLTESTDHFETINSYIDAENIDIIGMIYYKHNPIVNLFREATVKNLAKQLTIPFLVIPKFE